MPNCSPFQMRRLSRPLLLGIVVLTLSLILAMPPSVGVGGDAGALIPDEWFGELRVINPYGKLTQLVFISYESESAQTSGSVEIGDPDGDGALDAYELLGLWWNLDKHPDGVPYTVNPLGGLWYGLSTKAVVTEIKAALENWDLAVDYENYESYKTIYRVELYGDEVAVDYLARASTRYPDYKNVITWDRLRPGIVAVASIWYVSETGEVVDADIVLNYLYRWGIDPDDEGGAELSHAFDIQNVVTHEAGHWTGLADLYNEKYSEMTMYGYTEYGEVKKISLEPGDIAGAQKVYEGWRK